MMVGSVMPVGGLVALPVVGLLREVRVRQRDRIG